MKWFDRKFAFDLPGWMFPHVIERLRGTPARVEDFVGGVETLRAADLTNRTTHEANHNAADLEGLLAGFRNVRMELVTKLEAAGDDGGEVTAIHPRLEKPMRLIDHAFFVAEHDDHHLVMMRRVGLPVRG